MIIFKPCINSESWDILEQFFPYDNLLSYDYYKIKSQVLNLEFDPYIIQEDDRPIGVINVLKETKKHKLPFINFCNIYIGDNNCNGYFVKNSFDNHKIITQIIDQIIKITGKKCIINNIFLLINKNYYEKNIKIFKKNKFNFEKFIYTLTIDLNSEELLWKNLNKKCRNEIRQGIERGVKISKENSLQGIKELFRIKQKYDYWGNHPLHIWSNFEELHKKLIDQGLINIYLAKISKNKVIAAASIITYNKLVIYYIAGMDSEYGWYRPLNVLIWEIMKNSSNQGYKIFDLNGIELDNQNQPLDTRSKFKIGFGGQIKQNYILKKANFFRGFIC